MAVPVVRILLFIGYYIRGPLFSETPFKDGSRGVSCLGFSAGWFRLLQLCDDGHGHVARCILSMTSNVNVHLLDHRGHGSSHRWCDDYYDAWKYSGVDR